MSARIGIDLGGTHIKAALFDGDGRLLASDTRPTRDGEFEGGQRAWAAAVRSLVDGWEAKHGRAAIGLAAPGTRAALSLGNAIAWLLMLVYAVAAAVGLRSASTSR